MSQRQKKQAAARRDVHLQRAKRAYQEAGRQAVRQGLVSEQSTHLFGRSLAAKVKIEFRDVDFD